VTGIGVKLGFHCTWFNFPTFRFLGDHPASHPMGTGSSFSGCKAAGAWN